MSVTDIRHRQEQALTPRPGLKPKWTPEAARLVLEGWEHTTRNGVRIWRDTSENPTGYGSWTSEETAYGWITEGSG